MAGPLCFCCGKPIPKRTITVQVHHNEDYCKRMNGGNSTHWRYLHTPEPLRSKADCQARVNETVVSVRYGHIRNGKMDDRAVSYFSVWDGESYADRYFCGGPCRNRFAYAMARAGHCTTAYSAAIREIRERAVDAVYAARSTPSGDSHGNRSGGRG